MGSHSLASHSICIYWLAIPQLSAYHVGPYPRHPHAVPCWKHDMHQRGEQAQRKPADIHIHQPVMLFRLTRISREPLFVLPVLQLSFLVPIRRRQHRGHRPRNIHHPPARDKPQALSVSIPSLHSAPAPRHPSRGVRPLCSHRATNDMGIPPILAHPHTNPANACAAPSTILAAYIERPAERGCAAPCLHTPPRARTVRTTASGPHVTV